MHGILVALGVTVMLLVLLAGPVANWYYNRAVDRYERWRDSEPS